MSEKFSRREILIGMGLVSAGTVACACSGTVLASLWWLNQTTASPTQTAQPRFPQPPIVNRSTWGALPPNHNAPNESGFYNERNLEGWRIYDDTIQEAYQTVIIHHTAFYEENDLATLQEVQRLHRDDRGWADVAYHFLIGQNGIIYEGRDWRVRGTHVASYNTGSLGICLLGNFIALKQKTP